MTAAAVACATVQEPPGGPPDPDPPVLLSVTPDSGEVRDAFDDDLSFQFDEVIIERGIDQLVEVSPRHEQVDISWKRSRISVKPDGGWRDSTTYLVRLLPGITDLRSNRLDSGRTIVFSTGGPIPDTRLTGTAIDWEAGRIAANALVEAIRVSDSLTYVGETDSTGAFLLAAVPPGVYLLSAAIDQNNNQRRDSREAFDSVTVTLDSTVSRDFWMFPHDTLGPRIQNVTLLDSAAVAVEYNQPLAQAEMGPNDVRVLLLPDSIATDVEGVFWRSTYDSVSTARRDSIVADSLAALQDSLAADSLPADTAVAAPPPPDTAVAPAPPPLLPPDTAGVPAEAPDTSEVERLLRQRQPLTRSIVIVMPGSLRPGERYVIETTALNLLGIAEVSQRTLPIPAAPDSS